MILILILGYVSLLYCLILNIFIGPDIFNNIWLLFSIFFFFLYYITKQYLKNPKRIPLSFIVPVYVCSILGILVFIITSSIIISNIDYKAESNLDYVIVLGSKLDKKDLASNSLKKRLDKAREYIKDNPSTMLVLSGGKMGESNISEAEVMAAYLLNGGMAADKILVEIQAHNTRENIIYSFALIEKQLENKRQESNNETVVVRGSVLSANNKPQRIGILTSDFNSFRALTLAKKIKDSELYTISAKTDLIDLFNMYLRECLAILKEKFMGYI